MIFLNSISARTQIPHAGHQSFRHHYHDDDTDEKDDDYYCFMMVQSFHAVHLQVPRERHGKVTRHCSLRFQEDYSDRFGAADTDSQANRGIAAQVRVQSMQHCKRESRSKVGLRVKTWRV